MNKKIKIMHLINSFTLTGAEKLAFDIVSRMDKKKFDIFICAVEVKKNNIERYMREKLENYGVKTITINKIPTTNKQRVILIIKLAKIFSKNKIDILHTHCSAPDLYGRISAFLTHINLVFSTIHNTKGYSLQRERIMKNFCTKYIAISKEVEEYALVKLKIPSKKIKVIYNGIDVENFINCLVKKENKLKELGINNYDKIVTTVGRVNEQKGHIFFVKAAELVLKKFPDTNFLIIGNSQVDKDLYQKLIKIIKNKNLGNKIIFTGVRQDVPEILAVSDVFVLSSIYEGFALVTIEAAMASLPIVATDVGSIRQIVNNGENGLIVPPKDINALANGIKFILSDEDRAKKMGLKGKRIAKKFTIEKTVSEYEKLYLSYF